jgi:hypothetical protein
MSNIIIGALSAIPVTLLAWLAYNWAGKPILDVRSKRLDALKVAELYGFKGYGFGEDETNRAREVLSEAAISLRALNRGQPWTARLYCRLLRYELESAASVLYGLVGLVGAALHPENSSRRDAVDAVHLLLNASQHLSAERIREIREKLATPLALPRA